jgi:glycosyltransferase involved in cell wall biosynthesis
LSFNPGKSLEAVVRKLRPWLVPSYRRAFAGLLARGLAERREGERIVCCDFSNPAIDAVGGRYYFSLVRDLIDAGYFPVFTASRATLSTFGTSRMKSLLLGERLGVVASLDEFREPYFLITDRDLAKPALAEKMVTVSYEPRLCAGENEVAFPVFVHPQITTKVKLPPAYQVGETRAARIFFGGNTEEGKYDKDVLRQVYHMLTRREMLEAAAAVTPAYRPLDAASWLASAEFHPFVLCETQRCKIPQERWLEALGKADFFLACPGVGMPLCHNLIEALACGSIPILQYAAYLPQPLEDGVNCLAFQNSADLQEITAKVLTMSPEQIQALRGNVRAYYDEFLAPGRFAEKLFSGPQRERTLLINAYRVPRK